MSPLALSIWQPCSLPKKSSHLYSTLLLPRTASRAYLSHFPFLIQSPLFFSTFICGKKLFFLLTFGTHTNSFALSLLLALRREKEERRRQPKRLSFCHRTKKGVTSLELFFFNYPLHENAFKASVVFFFTNLDTAMLLLLRIVMSRRGWRRCTGRRRIASTGSSRSSGRGSTAGLPPASRRSGRWSWRS